MTRHPAATEPDAHSRLRPVTPVSIAAARLDELAAQLLSAGAPDTLTAQARELQRLVGGLEPYVEDCTSPASPALTELARATQARDWSRGDEAVGRQSAAAPAVEAEMLSGHVEGQVLKMLVRLGGARRVLEVGMFTGYSALAMAEGLPADGSVVACEIDPDVARFAREHLDASPAGQKIDIRVGPAQQTLRELAQDGELFDVVFIDADKAGYAGYLEQVLGAPLLAPDGIVLVDNTLLQGETYAGEDPGPNGAAIREFNARVADDPRVEQVVLPVRDGLTVIRRV